MTAQNPSAAYVCINAGQAVCPSEIAARSLCLNGDIGETLAQMK